MEDLSLLKRLERLGIHISPRKSPYEHVGLFVAKLSDILILPGAGDAVLFLLPEDVQLDKDVACQIEEIVQARGYRDRLKILEYGKSDESGLAVINQIPGLAYFSRSDLLQIKKTTPLKSFLTDIVVKRSSLAALNPYTYQGPVTGSRFFGREEELKILRLQTQKSFVLSGVRRSGKTSLMMELRNQLYNASTDLTVFVNFETCQTLADIPYQVLRRLGEELKARPSLSGWSDNLIRLASSRQWEKSSRLSHLATTLWELIYSREEAHRIRFLFDEYDPVVSLEKTCDRVFTKVWRDLVIRGKTLEKRGTPSYVQFIFAGSRKLYEEILSRSSPFFNIGAECLVLHNFNLDTLGSLVTRPMRELGVEVHDAARIGQVLIEQTGGHPATTQHLLSLVVADPQVERARAIGVEDVLRAASQQEFLGLLRNTLAMNVSPLGRFILAQIALTRKERVNVDFIQGVAKRNSIRFEEHQLNNELQDLANSGYLRALEFAAGQSFYKLAVPAVQRLFSNEDIVDLTHEMISKKLCTLLAGKA